MRNSNNQTSISLGFHRISVTLVSLIRISTNEKVDLIVRDPKLITFEGQMAIQDVSQYYVILRVPEVTNQREICFLQCGCHYDQRANERTRH